MKKGTQGWNSRLKGKYENEEPSDKVTDGGTDSLTACLYKHTKKWRTLKDSPFGETYHSCRWISAIRLSLEYCAESEQL